MDKFRHLTKFNDPKESKNKYTLEIAIDTRKTLSELKQRISEIINVPQDKFIIKKFKD